jgi:tellurite methyltransferase
MRPWNTRGRLDTAVRYTVDVIRNIDGFRVDDAGEWVAELSCLHDQHVRHDPPFSDRPWVLTESGRTERIGTLIECPLCDRAELPGGLEIVRTAGPFDDSTLPPALQKDHLVADRTWAVLSVLDGAVTFDMATTPAVTERLAGGDRQPIPPGVPHHVRLSGPARVKIDFLVRQGGERP